MLVCVAAYGLSHPVTRGHHAKSTTATRFPGDARLDTHHIANQWRRQADYHKGQDMCEKPYSVFRVKIDGTPVHLR
jgi:hypothetical protein